MKTAIKILIAAVVFFLAINTSYARSVKEQDELPGIKVYVKTSKIEEERSIHPIIDEETKELLYSITPEERVYNNYNVSNLYSSENPLDLETTRKIERIAYYGYGYKNRTDTKWYVITQVMIWKEILKDNGEIYFVDSNNNKTELFSKEREAILKDIKDLETAPSFLKASETVNYETSLNKDLVLIDTNDIISKFEIVSYVSNVEFKIEGNKLTIHAINPAGGIISFNPKISEPNNKTQIYTNSSSSKLINRGKIDPPRFIMNYRALNPKLVIKKGKSETSSLSLKGTEFNLYNNENQFLNSVILDENGLSKEYEFTPGQYYLIETKVSEGFNIYPDKIYFEIKRDDLTFEVPSNPILKKVTIKKELVKENGETISEEKATFEVYNKENKLVERFTTNELGKYDLELEYGDYKIIQIKGKEGYDIPEAINISINENSNIEEVVIKSNEIKNNIENNKNENDIKEETGTIIINKIDSLTNKPLEGVLFYLYDSNRNKIKEEYTNKDGKIEFKDLQTGIYYLKEIISQSNTELDENDIKIEVKNNIETTITSSNRTKIEVPKTGAQDFSILINIILIGLGYTVKNVKVK